MGRFDEVDKKEKELEALYNQLVVSFKDYMLETPHMASVTHIQHSPSIYTVPFSKVAGNSWCTSYFDTQACVKYLLEYASKSVSPQSFKQRISIVLETGCVKLGTEKHRMNGEVLKRLHEFIKG